MSVLLEESFDPPSAGPSTSYPDISPIPTFQLRRAIGEIETEVLVQTYGDRVLVVVTQNGKMGVVVSRASERSEDPRPQFEARRRRGADSRHKLLSHRPSPSLSLLLLP